MSKQKVGQMIDIQEMDDLHMGSHNIFGETKLIPNLNKTNNNRTQMFTAHIGQAIQLVNAETPNVMSGYENSVGLHSTGYRRIEEDERLEIVYIFEKNMYNKIYLVKDLNTGIYDIIKRTEAENLTEKYGIRYNNEKLDNAKVGEVLNDEVIYKDSNYDEEMNLQFGINLRTIFAPYKGYTNEDAIVISESAAKKMSSYFVRNVKVTINTNDIPLSLYSDFSDGVYKSFPEIGEEVQNGILMATRRLSNSSVASDFIDKRMFKTLKDDKIYQVEGKVVDIDIYNNENIEKLAKQNYSSQLLKHIEKQTRYWEEFVTIVDSIIKNNKVSSDLRHMYNKYKMYIDPSTKKAYNGTQFDKIVINFTVLETRPTLVASKLTSRYGSKGVISKIVPDEEMLKLIKFDGKDVRKDSKVIKPPEIILNPLGVINRLNPSY